MDHSISLNLLVCVGAVNTGQLYSWGVNRHIGGMFNTPGELGELCRAPSSSDYQDICSLGDIAAHWNLYSCSSPELHISHLDEDLKRYNWNPLARISGSPAFPGLVDAVDLESIRFEAVTVGGMRFSFQKALYSFSIRRQFFDLRDRFAKGRQSLGMDFLECSSTSAESRIFVRNSWP